MADTEAPAQQHEPAPQRPCHGCGQRDTHPRQIIVRSVEADIVELYHYDCVPEVDLAALTFDAGSQAGLDATAQGLRGAAVQANVYAAAAAAAEEV